MKRFSVLFSCTLCACLLLTACDRNKSPSEIIGSDSLSETAKSAFPADCCNVTLEKAVEKAVSLSPAVTEIVCELGFKSKLVGISDYCDFPEGISAQKVGSAENPDIDAIVALKPDAVFTLTQLSERETFALEHSGIAVLEMLPPTNIEEYTALYRETARAFYGKELSDGEKETEKCSEIAKSAEDALKSAAEGVTLGKFVYVTEKLTIAGADTFESAVLSLAGENIASQDGYVPADEIDGTPECIVADDTLSKSDITSDSTLLGFVNNGAEIYFVSSRCFERPSARTADIFTQLAEE